MNKSAGILQQNFVLQGDYIELYKLLKLESIASSGGEAKMLIANGEVVLNDVVELRKRKKLVTGDVIEVVQTRIRIL